MKVVAITGGVQGIGRGIALHFAAHGYAVSLADTMADAGEELLGLLKGRGAKASFAVTDVADPVSVEAWLTQTIRDLGCPTALVNNAGFMIRKPFLELPLHEFDAVISTNLRGTFICSQQVAREMAKRGIHGSIVNMASTRAFMSEPGTEGYTASKGAIVALTHGMAMSLAEQRIRVNSISPGWIETRDWQFSARSETPQHSSADREQHAVGRVGRPEDIAEACLYLAEAGFVTGQNLTVDGGMSVKMIYAE